MVGLKIHQLDVQAGEPVPVAIYRKDPLDGGVIWYAGRPVPRLGDEFYRAGQDTEAGQAVRDWLADHPGGYLIVNHPKFTPSAERALGRFELIEYHPAPLDPHDQLDLRLYRHLPTPTSQPRP
jgi:hypothetical protein